MCAFPPHEFTVCHYCIAQQHDVSKTHSSHWTTKVHLTLSQQSARTSPSARPGVQCQLPRYSSPQPPFPLNVSAHTRSRRTGHCLTLGTLEMSAMRAATLLLLLCCRCAAETQRPAAATAYYIAAVEIGWDYLDDVDPASDQR